MAIKEITRQEAKILINDGEAGWYAINANPPILHSRQYVYSTLDGRHFLTDGIKLTPEGTTIVGGIPKAITKLEAEEDSVIADIIKQEIAEMNELNNHINKKLANETKLPENKVSYTGKRTGP